MLENENINRKKAMKESTLYMIIFAIGTQILLFYKETLIASRIGTNYKMDSYVLALGALMLIGTTVGEGMIISIIPLLHQIKARKGKEAKEDFINNLLNLSFLLSLLLIILAYLGAPLIIRIFGPGFHGVELSKAIGLFRLGLPMIPLIWINAIIGGYLQTDHAFKAGARGGLFNAVIYIIYLVFFSEKFKINGLMLVGNLAIGFQIYLRIKVLKLRNFKYKFYINPQDKYLKKALILLFPILLGSGLSQINLVVDNALASTLELGSIAELNYANQVIQLFLGVFVLAIVTVTFPVLVESYGKENNEFKSELIYGVKKILILALPATMVFMTMAKPLVRFFFERGAFGLEASIFTSQALFYYGLGLPAMSLMPLLIKAYYAMNDFKRPISISAIGLIFNVGLDLLLISFMGAKGLALGTSIASSLAMAYGFLSLRKKLKV